MALSAGGVVVLAVPLAFGVPGSSGVVSMAVPLAVFWASSGVALVLCIWWSSCWCIGDLNFFASRCITWRSGSDR